MAWAAAAAGKLTACANDSYSESRNMWYVSLTRGFSCARTYCSPGRP